MCSVATFAGLGVLLVLMPLAVVVVGRTMKFHVRRLLPLMRDASGRRSRVLFVCSFVLLQHVRLKIGDTRVKLINEILQVGSAPL